jgi:hypothetical protein
MNYSTARRTKREPGFGAPGASRLRIEHLWLLVPALVVAWMGFMHPLRLLDFWWHLKVGEVIVTSGEIPRVDLFSFTHAGQPFIHHDWLGEVLYYVTYRIGAFPLVIALNTALLLLAFVLIFHMCFEATNRLRVAVLCGLVAVMALGWNSNVRPQVYSFAFFAAFYWILWGFRDGRRDCLWALPLLMVLWVNLHGAFALGLGLIGVVLGSEAVRRLVLGPRAGTLAPAVLAKLAWILGLTVLACMVNPEGRGVFSYVRQLQAERSVQQFVSEWQASDIKNVGHVLVFFGPFFLSVLVLFYTRCRLNATELGLFLAFAVLGLAASRHGIWFTLIVTPILARHATALEVPNVLEDLRARPRLGALMRPLEQPRDGRRGAHYGLNWALLTCLLLFTIMLLPWVRPHLNVKRLRPQLVEKSTPVGAMDYMAEQGLVGNVFHPQMYGDYLIWRLWPQQRSFFDGRVHLFDDSFVREYILTFQDAQWESRIAKYQIEFLLLPKDDPNSNYMIEDARGSTNWKPLYEDEVSVLFERQS